MKIFYKLPLLLFLIPALAIADPLTLRAAKAPGGPNPWDQPAQISYLSNTGGDDSYAINAAVSGNFPNFPNTTIQPQVTAWIAKNTLLAKKQDKRGLEVAVGFAGGDRQFGYIPQLSLSTDRDYVKNSDEVTAEATIDFTSVDLNLGGCSKALVHGCTYWDFLLGIYSNDVRSSENNTGLGTINGSKAIIKITSNPFNSTHSLSALSFSVLAQGQWDSSASNSRVKENRPLYKGTISWRFYKEGDSAKPSIALERVIGSDLLTGQDKQAYTQLAFRMGF